jgi:hypothetical protein
MTQPRRRLVRTPPAPPASDARTQDCLRRLRQRLARELPALARWMTRLRRAFHRVEQLQRLLARVDRDITRLEES